ncbi:AAA ATPase domain protein [anaerobic digester metagenome]
MEQLFIENFLVIKKAEFEIKKINLIIGPQANGKSVIAKLTYFFREFLSSTYIDSIRNFDDKRAVCKAGLAKFEQYFPRYAWTEQTFVITYMINGSYVKITKDKAKKKESSLKLTYSKDLEQLHRKTKLLYKEKLDAIAENKTKVLNKRRKDIFPEVSHDNIYKYEHFKNIESSIFIPASRSFFANLKKYIFSFLANNLPIDPFIKDFGSTYETIKTFYDAPFIKDIYDDHASIDKIDELTNSILQGRYSYEKEQDWIVNKQRKINLSNASSGQQEALPLLLILSLWPRMTNTKSIVTYFIEEPEAHLFPTSQKHIVSLISYIYQKFNHSFVITTHSPYILTAFNNLIFANDLCGDNKLKSDVCQIVDTDCLIQFEDFTAYTITNGELISIMNDETRLIGTNIIDAVSEEFDQVFDKLIQLQLEDL